MSRNKQIGVILIILVLGFLLQSLKRIGQFSLNDPANPSARAASDFEIRPFQMTSAGLEEERLRALREPRGGMRLAGAPNGSSYDFSEGHKVAEIVAKATESIKKKQKKKKSARGNKKDSETQFGDNKNNPLSKDRNKNGLHPNSSQTAQFQQIFTPAEENPNKLPVTYEDWAKLILGRPQPENVAKLIEFFQNNMVSAEVFYALLQALMAEPSKEQHVLAVRAASAVPNSTSFMFFVETLKNEPQGSELAGLISSQLDTYKTLKNVSTLKFILTAHMNDANTTQIAVQLLDDSTQSYLEQRAPSTTDDSFAQVQTAARRSYSGFTSVLEKIVETYSSTKSISAPAQKALERINNLTVVVAETNG